MKKVKLMMMTLVMCLVSMVGFGQISQNINLEKASEDEVNKSRIQAIALIQAKIAAETKAAEIARITNEVDAEKRTITENLLDDMKLEDYARQKSLTAIQTYLTKVSKANSGFEEENIRVQRWKEKQLDNLSKDPILRFKEMQEINAREKERLKEISDSQQKVWGELQGQLRDTGVEYDKYIQVFGQLEKLERESRSDLRFTIDYYSTYENVVNELQLKVVELANAKGEESGETNKNTKTINKNTKAVDANTEAKKINKEFSLFSDRENQALKDYVSLFNTYIEQVKIAEATLSGDDKQLKLDELKTELMKYIK